MWVTQEGAAEQEKRGRPATGFRLTLMARKDEMARRVQRRNQGARRVIWQPHKVQVLMGV